MLSVKQEMDASKCRKYFTGPKTYYFTIWFATESPILLSIAQYFPCVQKLMLISPFSIITQVIIEILALSLAENGVIFCYNHLPRGQIITGRQIFKIAASRFVDVSEEEINLMKENAILRNNKHATKFEMTLIN